MKTDLDQLMQSDSLDALIVTGAARHNPMMVYFTGGGHMTYAALIKPRGREPTLFHQPMERDEAANSGLLTFNLSAYPIEDLLKEADGDTTLAYALLHQKMLTEAGVTSGRMALYGITELGQSFAVFTALQRLMPDLEIVGEVKNPLLLRAMATKDAAEVERIRQMGRITVDVVGQVAEFLSSHHAKNGVLVKFDDQPLTIGEVKNNINLWLHQRGVDNPHGCIFAIGRDAGIPHSAGNLEDMLTLGKTIVFDIFPCEPGGGYHYDFTRTWCLGYAPDDVQALYDDVYAVYQQIMHGLKAGEPCTIYQQLACDLFEARGHPTTKEDPKIQEGYVHGLGHGLGLHIHEIPYFRNPERTTEFDHLHPGVVMTVEPGLYYPEKGMGCRLEDTVYVRPDGEIEVLAAYPLDLVIPVRGG